MVRLRGFLLKHRVITLFRWFFRRRRTPAAYRRLNPTQSTRVKPFSKLLSFTRTLRIKAQAVVSNSLGQRRGYLRVGQEPVLMESVSVPKGHLAVYVGEEDGNSQRILVPVGYFNNPLFVDLLKESEKEYGFNHPGGITIPCPVSEFELVQTRIKAIHRTRKLGAWKRSTTTRRLNV